MTKYPPLFCVLLAIWACGEKAVYHTDNTASPETIIINREQYEAPGHCDTATNRGVVFKADYVLLGGKSKAAQAINDSLRSLVVSNVLDWLDSASIAAHPKARTDLSEAAKLFATEYQHVMQEVGLMSGCWELDIRGDTVYTGDKALTVRMETYANTGGAHPNTYTAYYCFNRQTGKLLRLTDIIVDTTALLPIVERAFQQKQQSMKAQLVDEETYLPEGGEFFLPENIGLSRDGMIFYYNPYEIASYAYGPIEIVIPYTELQGILNKEMKFLVLR